MAISYPFGKLCFAKFTGKDTVALCKDMRKRLAAGKTVAQGNLANGSSGIHQLFISILQAEVLQISFKGSTGIFLKHP